MTAEEQAAQAAEAAAQAAAAAEAAAKAEAASTDPAVLRAKLERAVESDKKTRERAQRAEAEAQKANAELARLAAEKAASEEKSLVEKGQFKELAEARAKDLESTRQELEQARGKLSSYEQREAEDRQKREALVASDFAALPEELRSGIGADDVRAQELTVNAYRAAQGQKPRTPTIPSTAPRPASPGATAPYTADQIRIFNQIAGNPRAPSAKRDEARAALAKAKDWKTAHGG